MDKKSLIFLFFLIIMIFVIPYFWRRSRDTDIEKNGKYAIGVITKKSGSLKNGNHWHYQFSYQNKIYESYRSTHIGWDVSIGDYFLIKFSSKNPNRSKILYEYMLKDVKSEHQNYSGDTIPYTILEYREKKERF